MLYHLCVVLLFVATSNGQRQPYPVGLRAPVTGPLIEGLDPGSLRLNNQPGNLPRDNLMPRDNLLPSENLLPGDGQGIGILTSTISDDNREVSTELPIIMDRPIDIGNNNRGNDGGVIPIPSWESQCKKRFGYYRIAAKCDSFVECRNFRAAERLCPDGMHFNPEARWPEYPCGYPMDVPCLDRGTLQPPKPTAECPHQYGYYPITDGSLSPKERCSRYLMCSEGRAVHMNCPFGLAFDPATGRCDWPELVPSCKDFLGFKCPPPTVVQPETEEERQASQIIQNFKYSENECYYFWSCSEGRARVLSCDFGLAFDAVLGRCVDEELARCKVATVNIMPESVQAYNNAATKL